MSAPSAALGIGLANHPPTHRGLVKKGNLITVTFVYIVCFFFHYQNSLFLFLPHPSLQMQSRNISSLRDSTNSSCGCLVQKKNGTTGRSEQLLWVQQSDISADKCLLRQFSSVCWEIPSCIKHLDYVRPDKSATASCPSHLWSICDSWKNWEVRWWCQTEQSGFSMQRNSRVDAAQCFRFRKVNI